MGGVEKRTARYRALRRATWVHPKEGTSWTNRSARDMITEGMHDVMVPRGALHIGFTQDQVIEVFMHLMLYGGIPFARGAMDIANDVFING